MKTGDFFRMRARLGRARGVVFLAVLAVHAAGCGSKGKYDNATYTVGGAVTGLNGIVVLQINGGDDVALSADGPFTFPTAISRGTSYSVAVRTQPPGQICTVTNGSGSISGFVTNVAVKCVAASFNVGGGVTGLAGTLVLQNNGADDTVISVNGAFSFATAVPAGGSYNVTVKTQPAGQQCSVSSGGGVANANVANVVVSCISYWTVGGTVAGLAGTVVLQNNGRDDLAVSGNGSFTFGTALANGDAYNVTVVAQPNGKTCAVTNGAGVATGSVTNVQVTCVTNTYTIGGTVAGLNGTVTLRNNGGDNLSVTANGGFTFANAVAHGSSYNVTVLAQPTGQTCSVANGVGTVTGNITNVQVTCATKAYTIGGTVSGLTGTVVLQNNGSNDLSVSANGSFAFSTAIAHGGAYAVAVKTLPAGQQCTVSNGSGMATGNVTNVTVTCVNLWTIGGNVSGLTGTVVLQNNGGDDLSVSADGAFSFATRIADNGAYAVSIKTQPADQHCTVANESGVASANVTTVSVTCKTHYTIGGTVSGLIGTVVLQNNGGDDRSVTADGPFSFAAQILDGNGYAVTVKTQPTGQNCAVGSGSGTVNGANVTNVSVTCSVLPPIAPTLNPLSYRIKTFKFSWAAVPDATHYKLLENPDGISGFTQVGGDIPAGTTNYDHVVALYQRINASYKLQACNSGGCTDSATLSISGNLVEAIGYIKASNTGAGDHFGSSLALSADGNTLAVGAYNEDSNATGVGGDANDNSAVNRGAAYVFSRSAVVWSQQAYVKSSNAGANHNFGWSVALSGDGNTFATGAPQEGSNAGAAYVFTRIGISWSQQAQVQASNAGNDDRFGSSVALSSGGNALAVSAIGEASSANGIDGNQNSDTDLDSGAAYVFTRSVGIWSQKAYLKASNSQAGDAFGISLGLSADGNTLAIGATGEDSSATGIDGSQGNNTAPDSGALYLY